MDRERAARAIARGRASGVRPLSRRDDALRVDDIAIGRLLRSIRIRLRLRQVDVGKMAGLSQQLVSLLELGSLEHVSVPALRRVARAVGAEVVISIRWRGADVDRLRDEDHAQIVATVAGRLEAAGWLTATEVTYSVRGERGSIDVLAFHPVSRTLLVIEVRSELVSAEETIRRLDQKVRLAPKIGAERLGWSPVATARLLSVMDTRTARRRVERHDSLFGRAFPIPRLGGPGVASSARRSCEPPSVCAIHQQHGCSARPCHRSPGRTPLFTLSLGRFGAFLTRVEPPIGAEYQRRWWMTRPPGRSPPNTSQSGAVTGRSESDRRGANP